MHGRDKSVYPGHARNLASEAHASHDGYQTAPASVKDPTVQDTTDLTNWTALTGLVETFVPMDVVDLSASNYPARFYRASTPTPLAGIRRDGGK